MKFSKSYQKIVDLVDNAKKKKTCEKCLEEKEVIFKMPSPLKIGEFIVMSTNSSNICLECFVKFIETEKKKTYIL